MKMELSLLSPAKKWTAAAAALLASLGYLSISATRFVAAQLSNSGSLKNMQRAVLLDPGSAEYRNAIGVFEVMRQSPESAIAPFQEATRLNPNSGKYWMDLAVAEQLQGDLNSERQAIERALDADPRTPELAWQAANLYLAQGGTDAAMKQFHTVLENDPVLLYPAINTAWKIRPDVDFLLQNVVPPLADTAFLAFLLSRNETAAAAKTWQRMFAEQESVEREDVLDYIRYLLAHQEVSQASLVWQQAAKLAELAAYQPSAENLLINGDFSLDILNGGFDWMHQQLQGVSLALDPTETHSSSRSLRITLDGAVSDAGIAQRVPVKPNQTYEFSAFFKSKDMDGAGTIQFAINDAYTGKSLFMSDDLKQADFWKKTGGIFTTSAETRLLLLHVVRMPPDSAIRGRLWIDGLQLVERGAGQ